MACFEDAGFSKLKLLDLNRVGLHQQVLILLDVLSADGRYIGKKIPHKAYASRKMVTLCISTRKTPSG